MPLIILEIRPTTRSGATQVIEDLEVGPFESSSREYAALRGTAGRTQGGLGSQRGGKSDPMFAAENLRDWLGHTVIDPEGNKIGTLEAVYVDTTSDEPSFITVRIGMISRHRLAFVPVTGATVSPKAVRVQYAKKVVQDAPAIDTDGELAATAEPGVFAYYNLDYGSRSERRLARR